MRFFSVLLIAFLAWPWGLFSAAAAADREAVVVIGDSVGAGVLADTRLGERPSPELWKKIVRLVFSGDFSMPNLHRIFAQPELAAFTGTRVESFAVHLAARLPHLTFQALNVSFAGDHVSESLEKARTLKESLAQENLGNARIIVLEVGANDVCGSTSVAGFREDYGVLVQLLRAQQPGADILAVPVVPLASLPVFEYVYESRLGITCETLRTRLCRRLGERGLEERVDAFNDAIRQAVAGTETLVLEEVSTLPIEREDLAFDCFHPSRRGHEKIARASWESYVRQGRVSD